MGQLQARCNRPVSIQELDNLDDAAVQQTYTQVMQERAKRIRAADRGHEQPTDPVFALLQQKAEFENR